MAQSSNNLQGTNSYRLVDDETGASRHTSDISEEVLYFGDIEQRIQDTIRDDTHPSTDSDADAQEMYDEGFIQ